MPFLDVFCYILNAQVETLNFPLPNFQEIFLGPNRNFSTLPELRITTCFCLYALLSVAIVTATGQPKYRPVSTQIQPLGQSDCNSPGFFFRGYFFDIFSLLHPVEEPWLGVREREKT